MDSDDVKVLPGTGGPGDVDDASDVGADTGEIDFTGQAGLKGSQRGQ